MVWNKELSEQDSRDKEHVQAASSFSSVRRKTLREATDEELSIKWKRMMHGERVKTRRKSETEVSSAGEK